MQTQKFQLWRMWFKVQNKNNSVLYKFFKYVLFFGIKKFRRKKKNKMWNRLDANFGRENVLHKERFFVRVASHMSMWSFEILIS
jgi:hypothetical protein